MFALLKHGQLVIEMQNDGEHFVVAELIKILKDCPDDFVLLSSLAQKFKQRNNSPIKSYTSTSIKNIVANRPHIFKKRDWNDVRLATQLVGTRQTDETDLGSQDEKMGGSTTSEYEIDSINIRKIKRTRQNKHHDESEYTNVYINYITPDFKLVKEFERFGSIGSVNDRGQYAYINYFNHDDAVAAIDAMDGLSLFNSDANRHIRLKVKFAPPKYQQPVQEQASLAPVLYATETEDVHESAKHLIESVLKEVADSHQSHYLDVSQLSGEQRYLMLQYIKQYECYTNQIV
jgi:hypothetical protein